MPIKLSFAQKRIVVCKSPRIIVKACPGSGKTLSVAARLARLLQSNNLGRHQGVAVLSFTNTACEEIKKKLKEEFGRTEDIGYPHFIGTIDSFINNYIFLPYGHLEMGCIGRPEIVGTEFNKWYDYDSSKKNYNRTKIVDPNYFFDKVSFDKNNNLLRLAPNKTFNFEKKYWVNQRNDNQEIYKYILDLMNMKRDLYKVGKANQADANYISHKTIKDKPAIGKNLVERFPIIIIDEAQDSTDIQMSMIDLLIKYGLKNIMLIGDPDQAIFEWNTANPELFKKKWDDEEWHRLELKENYRSSTHICKVLNSFYGNTIVSKAEDKDCLVIPNTIDHNNSVERIKEIQQQFYEECSKFGIPDNERAIVYRGRGFGEKFFGIDQENTESKELPWVKDNYFVRDIAHGKYLIEIGHFRAGIKLLEKGYLKRQLNKATLSAKEIQDYKDLKGYRVFREELFDFISKLGIIRDRTLKNWQQATKNNGIDLMVDSNRADLKIEKLFYYDETTNQDSYINTIHSVKGMSLDAILVFLKKDSASKNYSTILHPSYSELDSEKRNKDQEEIRVVYVAVSRPRKILWISVPSDDKECWENFLYPKNKSVSKQSQLKLDLFPE